MTKPVRDNLNPSWPDRFVFPMPAGSRVPVVLVEVWDQDVVFDDFLGEGQIPLDDVGTTPMQITINLLPRNGKPVMNPNAPSSVTMTLRVATGSSLPAIPAAMTGSVEVYPELPENVSRVLHHQYDFTPMKTLTRYYDTNDDLALALSDAHVLFCHALDALPPILSQHSLPGTLPGIGEFHSAISSRKDVPRRVSAKAMFGDFFHLCKAIDDQRADGDTTARLTSRDSDGTISIRPRGVGLMICILCSLCHALHLTLDLVCDLMYIDVTALPSPVEAVPPDTLASVRFLADHFTQSDVLGSGKYGVVRRATNVATSEPAAVKTVNKLKVGSRGLEAAYEERSILQLLNHRYIVRLVDFFEDPYNVYFVMELVQGGDLFSRIKDMHHYSEQLGARMIRCLFGALSYIHAQGIAHRDVKPENVLLCHALSEESPPPPRAASSQRDREAAVHLDDANADSFMLPPSLTPPEQSPDAPPALTCHPSGSIMMATKPRDHEMSHIKIADFGFAVRVTAPLTMCCGTPLFIAPEVLRVGYFKTQKDGYSYAADVWSMGVLVYVLLCGFPPFNGRTRNHVFRAICDDRIAFPVGTIWDDISPLAKDFVLRCLERDPEKRITAADCLLHPFLQSSNITQLSSISRPTLSSAIGSFCARYKFVGVVHGVRFASRLVYMAACDHLKVSVNSGALEALDQRSDARLRIAGNYLTGAGAAALVPAAADGAVEEVQLTDNELDDEAVELLARELLRIYVPVVQEWAGPRLAQFRVSSPRARSPAADAPALPPIEPGASSLRHRVPLRSLDLSGNPVSVVGARHILRVVQEVHSIVSVKLNATRVPRFWVARIDAAARFNSERPMNRRAAQLVGGIMTPESKLEFMSATRDAASRVGAEVVVSQSFALPPRRASSSEPSAADRIRASASSGDMRPTRATAASPTVVP